MEVTSYLLGKNSGGGGEINLQNNKAITITTNNSTTEVTPDEGYDATKKVTVTTNIPTGSTIDLSSIGYTSQDQQSTVNVLNGAIDYAEDIYNNWDATVTNRKEQYQQNYNIRFFPNVDMSNVTDARNMFTNCYSLISISDDFLKNFGNSDLRNMFYNCHSLERVGDIGGTGFRGTMFYGCENLKYVKSIFISVDNNNNGIFSYCTNLETIEEINTNITSFKNAFVASCPKLSNDTLKVILGFAKKLTSQTTSYKKLSTFGLSQTQAELCTTFDEWTDLENAGWVTGY